MLSRVNRLKLSCQLPVLEPAPTLILAQLRRLPPYATPDRVLERSHHSPYFTFSNPVSIILCHRQHHQHHQLALLTDLYLSILPQNDHPYSTS
jgi:hypothetical protein